jgi:predicted alpha/beta-fold hydrolase
MCIPLLFNVDWPHSCTFVTQTVRADDPFISDKLPDAAGAEAMNGAHANVIAARTKRGGHLGWLQVGCVSLLVLPFYTGHLIL